MRWDIFHRIFARGWQVNRKRELDNAIDKLT